MEDRGGKESFHSFFHTFGFLNNTNISSTKKKKKRTPELYRIKKKSMKKSSSRWKSCSYSTFDH